MADTGPSSSSGAREHDETEDEYFGTFTARFAVKHQAWAEEGGHRPLTVSEYEESLETNQTSTCATLAALRYQQDKEVGLEEVVGIDSHMFPCKWVSPDDMSLCFHTNFSAVVGGRKKSNFFFAEVVGTNCPQAVNACVLLETTNSSLKNCKFCTGMWHPAKGGFLGCKNMPPPGASTIDEPPAKKQKTVP